MSTNAVAKSELSTLESFLGQNPSAVPVVGDGTLWSITFDQVEGKSRQAGLLAPAFPLSCRGIHLLCQDQDERDDFKWQDRLMKASDSVKDKLGPNLDDTEVPEFIRLVKDDLAKDATPHQTNSLQNDDALSVNCSMARVLGEIDCLVGWDKVQEVSGGSVTLQDCDGDGAIGLTLSIPTGYPRVPPTVESCELPEAPSLSSWDADKSTVADVYQAFMTQVSAYRPVLDMLSELDRCAWVVDPERPCGRDLFRTLVIKPGVTVRVTIDDLDSATRELPEIRLMGSESELERLRNNLVENVERYRPEESLLQNLERILEVDFPHPEDLEQQSREDFNVDCCICYSFHLGQSVPERSCDNSKCGKRFHCDCLLQYLQSNVENVRGMGIIHGACPYCDAKISCREL